MVSMKELAAGGPPPWLRRVVKKVGRSINRFEMIRGGDEVLIGSSGGKDSLVLAVVLSLRRTWLPIDYSLRALHIDWEEYPMTEEEKSALAEYFDGMEIPLKIVRTPMKNESFRGTFNCYLCARNRRRILFEEASRLDIQKIALGHHLDDIVETILINLCFRGTFDTMRPVQDFFSGDLRIIRPMCELPETAVTRVAERLNLPVVEKRCPHEKDNVRARLKPIIRELSHIDRHTRTHMFEAVFAEGDERRLQDRENGSTLQSGRLP